MRVSSIQLQDFRGFEAATLSLDRPLTVLVGVNGSGKTSVLEALVRLLNVIGSSKGIDIDQPLPVDADIRRVASACKIATEGVEHGQPFAITIDHTRGGHPNTSSSLPERSQSTQRMLPAAYYAADRVVPDRRYSRTFTFLFSTREGNLERLESLQEFQVRADVNFAQFFQWFRFREDYENEQRARGAPAYEDRALKAVRDAIERVVPGISRLRVQRIPYRLVATKSGAEYELDQLSDGERGLLAMVGDLAFRLTIAYPDLPDPLQGEMLVLIDEIEQHLHPSWQRIVTKSLRRAFPNCQLIVTTHSPQVLSEVPNDAVMLLQDFQFFRPAAPSEGRDANAILLEVLGVEARPHEIVQEIEVISGLLDEGQDKEARARLDRLAQALTERDSEVTRLRGAHEDPALHQRGAPRIDGSCVS